MKNYILEIRFKNIVPTTWKEINVEDFTEAEQEARTILQKYSATWVRIYSEKRHCIRIINN